MEARTARAFAVRLLQYGSKKICGKIEFTPAHLQESTYSVRSVPYSTVPALLLYINQEI